MMEGEKPSEFRRLWRLNWLWSIYELSNAALQRLKWLDPEETNPHWSYVEFMCEYFDDLALSNSDGGYNSAIAEHLVTEEEAEIVAPLHELLERHNAPNGCDYDHECILNDPTWIAIVREAQSVRQHLLHLLDEPAEAQELEGGHR